MSDDNREEQEEIILCSSCEDHAEDGVRARSDVLRVAGYSAAGAPYAVLGLTWVDSVLKHYPWIPDERVVAALIASYGLLALFHWKSSKE